MSKQKNILNFFSPLSRKREGSENCIHFNKSIKLDEKSEECLEDIGDLIALSKKLPVVDSEMGYSWFKVLKSEFDKPYFAALDDFVRRERQSFKVYPPTELVWSWTKFCEVDDVKVVIIGQDPYHNPRQAAGLSFSVPKGVPAPPSLVNIFKELSTDIEGFKKPSHGDLTSWAKQGVLLLNACLTVRENAPNSHSDKGWERITDATINAISERSSGVVFLLWGAFAQKKAACVDKNKHHLLKSPHPSPLSASRGFLGCKHFSNCNKLLANGGKAPINWCID